MKNGVKTSLPSAPPLHNETAAVAAPAANEAAHATDENLQQHLRKLRILLQQNRTETAKRLLSTLIRSNSASQLYTLYSLSSPPPTKPIFSSFLLSFYAELKLPDEATEVYDLIKRDGNFPSLYAFNLFLESLVSSRQYNKTLEVFLDAVNSGIRVDKFSCGKTIQSAVKLGDMEGAVEKMRRMRKCGIKHNGFVYNVVIGGLSKEGRVEDERTLVEEMVDRGE